MQYLLAHGAQIKKQNIYKDTALSLAVHRGHYRATQTLCDHGANPNVKNVGNSTPLFLAVRNERDDLIKLLLKYGANINEENRNVYTVFLRAIEDGSMPIVKFIVENGANIHKTNRKGEPLFEFATRMHRHSIARYLQKEEQRRGSPNIGWEPISEYAILEKFFEITTAIKTPIQIGSYLVVLDEKSHPQVGRLAVATRGNDNIGSFQQLNQGNNNIIWKGFMDGSKVSQELKQQMASSLLGEIIDSEGNTMIGDFDMNLLLPSGEDLEFSFRALLKKNQ